jgi:competence ComEA-like helix-hairpin-helix protein
MAVLCAACIAAGAGAWARAVKHARPIWTFRRDAVERERIPYQATEPPGAMLDLNAADQQALETLPGVGPAIAARILEYRELVGGFTDAEELVRVRGVGYKMMAQFRPLVYASPDE